MLDRLKLQMRRKAMSQQKKESGKEKEGTNTEAQANVIANEGVMTMLGRKKKEKKAEKAMDAGARAKRMLARKIHAKYVSGSTENVPDDIAETKGYQPEIEHSKLGDAKKKADKKRESKLPPHLQGDAIGKMRKAFASEDKAFDFVKNKLKAKYGDGVLTTGEKMKPQSAADKAKARAHQAKVDKENAAERAKDPSQGRYPKG